MEDTGMKSTHSISNFQVLLLYFLGKRMEERAILKKVHYMANVAFILAYIEFDLIIASLMLLQISNNSVCNQINISDAK